MDKAIERHLARRGVRPTPPQRTAEDEMRRNADFFRWFEECVMGFDPEEYRRAFWREARKSGHTIGPVPYGLAEYRRGSPVQRRGSLLFYLAAMACSLPFWFIRRAINRHLAQLRRPTYYEAERRRRHELAEERRRVRRRRTVSPMPSMDEIRAALARALGSPADMIRLGSLLEDLECYVDNSIYFNEKGKVAGRRGGIRRHLQEYAPDLYARYKTLMRYKSLARKFRQAAGESDPVPASALLPSREFTSDGDHERGGADGVERADGTARSTGTGETRRRHPHPPARRPAVATVKPRAEAVRAARELLAGCEASCVSLAAQLALSISPDYTPMIDPRILRHGRDETKLATEARRHGRDAMGVA